MLALARLPLFFVFTIQLLCHVRKCVNTLFCKIMLTRETDMQKCRMNKTPKSKRDLTKDQFIYQARKLGFEPQGFMGYWMHSDSKVAVSVFNAGNRRRDWIAYLRKQVRRLNQERLAVQS